MLNQHLGTVLIVLGALVCGLNWALPNGLVVGTTVSSEQAQEYQEAASAFHAATSVPLSRQDAAELKSARERFEAAKTAVESIRARSRWIHWVANTGGFVLVLIGGLIHIAASKAS